MKIDFTRNLLSIKGEPLKASEDANAADITLEDVATNGLLTPAREPKTFDESAKMFNLALRITNACKADRERIEAFLAGRDPNDNEGLDAFKFEGCDVKSEEITLIKQAIGRVYGPQVCGPVELLLEA